MNVGIDDEFWVQDLYVIVGRIVIDVIGIKVLIILQANYHTTTFPHSDVIICHSCDWPLCVTRISVAPRCHLILVLILVELSPLMDFFSPLVQQMPLCDSSFQMCHRQTECPTLFLLSLLFRL